MYRHTDILDVRRVPNRNTRAAIRYKFYTERYDNIDYKNSLYYKVAELWDMLPLATIECESIFGQDIKHMLYEMYFGYAVLYRIQCLYACYKHILYEMKLIV